MIVDKAFMTKLRSEARAWCGGCKHSFEVQVWNGHIDIDGLDLEDNDEIDLIALHEGAVLPDNAGDVDIAVWGESRTLSGTDRLGNFSIEIVDGRIAETWQ